MISKKREENKKKKKTLHLVTKWKTPVASATFVFTNVQIYYLLSHKI